MELAQLRSKLLAAKTVTFDTETDTPISADGPSWLRDNVVSVGFAWGPTYEQSAYVRAKTPGLKELLSELLGPTGPRVVAHNAKFDLHMVRKSFGVRHQRRVHDTMTQAHLVNENKPKGLKPRAVAEFPGEALDVQEAAVKDYIKTNRANKRSRPDGVKCWGDIPHEMLEPYCRTDCTLTWRLDELFVPQIKATPQLEAGQTLWDLYETELDLTTVLLKMEAAGVLVDREFLEQQQIAMTAELEEITATVAKLTGQKDINLGSDAQLRKLLYEDLRLPTHKKTRGGAWSTDAETLAWLLAGGEQLEILTPILRYGSVAKQLSSYVNSSLEWSQWDGRVHADFFSCGTRTGRFSCSKPNLQNVTRPDAADPTTLVARRTFICDPGIPMTMLDYDQIEMRGYAHYTGDRRLCQVYHDKRDVYSEVASWIWGGTPEDHPKGTETRRKAKTTGLAIIYGASGRRIGLQLGRNAKQGRAIIDTFFNRSPRSRELFSGVQRAVALRNFVYNEFGRRRHLTSDEAYKAVNSLIQGWAADLIKDAMVRIDRLGIVETNAEHGFRLQVHDEVRLDGLSAREERDVEEAMTAYNLLVPVTVSVTHSTTNWAAAK